MDERGRSGGTTTFVMRETMPIVGIRIELQCMVIVAETPELVKKMT